MRTLLLPIKDLRNAKQRLASVLTPEERFGLAQAMLADTIRAVLQVRLAGKIFVVTNYEPAMGLDLPLVQASDIDELLAVECAAPAAVMVPSRDGTGTNALLRFPPTLFMSHFGAGSFAQHRREAEQANASIFIRRNARLEMDVDDESDLRELLRHDLSATVTGQWLEESGVAARFRARAFAV